MRLGHAEGPLAHAGVHRLGGDPRGRHGGDLRVRDVLSEEGPASEELEEDEAGRPDVERGAKADRRVQRDRERHRELGRHVPARVARGERRAVLDGTSKVDELEFAGAAEPHEVVRLDVTVHEANLVHTRQQLQHALRESSEHQSGLAAAAAATTSSSSSAAAAASQNDDLVVAALIAIAAAAANTELRRLLLLVHCAAAADGAAADRGDV
mmetsp:Transcript_43988/g.142786  ORF Transcript_43988/g.142786 Transcript_43988/m.142786 type:complete len:211 (+) Transcript_43988:962-1594(+)